MSDDTEKVAKHTYANLTAAGVTNFQLIPDNGGFTVVFGARRLEIQDDTFGSFPTLKVEPVSALFFSTSMLKELHRVFGNAIKDYETMWGSITIPGVDAPNV